MSDSWGTTRLRFLLNAPLTYGATESGSEFDAELPRYIRITDIRTDGSLEPNNAVSLSRIVAEPYLLNDKDVLLARSGATVGKAFLYRANGGDACFAGYLIRARCEQRKVLPEYLAYFLQSADYWSFINGNALQATIQNVSAEIYKEVPVTHPSVEGQAVVVAYLNQGTEKIDRLILMRRRQMALLKEQRAALIQQAVTRGLNPNAPIKDSGLPWLGEVPAHWEVKEIRYLVPQNRQVMYGIVLPGPNVDEGVPIVKAGNCEPGRLSVECMHRTTFEIEAGYVRSRLKAGDIVYAIRGSFGEAEIVPPELEGANLTQDAARIAPKPGINNRWLWYAVRSQAFFAQMDSVAVGATIRGVNIRDLKRGKLAVPPISEQKQIADFIDSESTRFDAIHAAYARQLTLLAEYRAALIHECVTGQRRVGEDLTLERL
jgi:type I restriction enzyme S subunit